MAVTAGKKIKTEVPFSHGNPSVIHQAIRFLEEGGYHVRNKVCMVIGNGEMGKNGSTDTQGGRCGCDGYNPSVQKRSGKHSGWMQQNQLWGKNGLSAGM